ncbi:hypothetical protein B0H16DRAFT_1903408 [Mycena metata]|uniref:Uncharacterized protein n=1 Tax=Mycena metata TaxID=1033252 RepID=A0AAD7DT61_9AGAR|nr:hypothetical protein B0H16DRAFT_1903408 [Mycena metata]
MPRVPKAKRVPEKRKRGQRQEPDSGTGNIFVDFDLLEHASKRMAPLKPLPAERPVRVEPLRRSARNAGPAHPSTPVAPTPIPSRFMGIQSHDTTDAPKAKEHGLKDVPPGKLRWIYWDATTDRLIIDRGGRIIVILRRGIRGKLADDAATAFNDARSKVPAQGSGRRGKHASSTVGTSLDFGNAKPTTLAGVPDAIQALMQLLCILSLAKWGSDAFKEHNPNVWGLYDTVATAVRKIPGVTWNFIGRYASVFASATFNLGPRTVTFPHYDGRNLLWGWCVVTALGWFKPKRGGHLILWDLGLVIEFPPGASILFPSALIRHSNVKVGRDETRFSFTQFSSAGLFRWVHNNGMTDADVEAAIRGDRSAQEARWEAANTRPQCGIDSYSCYP